MNIQTAFTSDHEHGFNTVAEIPGTDPRVGNHVVMVGGHLDSWLAGTVIAMEAVRLLRALDVEPSAPFASLCGPVRKRANSVPWATSLNISADTLPLQLQKTNLAR